MKAISIHFRCDLCGKYSNLGVTESYNLGKSDDVRAESTICVRCIANANTILFQGLLVAAEPAADTIDE